MQPDKNLRKKFKRTAFIFSRDFTTESMYKHEEQLIFREEMKDAQSVRGAVVELMRKFVKKQQIKVHEAVLRVILIMKAFSRLSSESLYDNY